MRRRFWDDISSSGPPGGRRCLVRGYERSDLIVVHNLYYALLSTLMNDPIHETLDVEGGRRRPGETTACICLAVLIFGACLAAPAGTAVATSVALRRSKGRIKHDPPLVVRFEQVDEWIFLFLLLHVVVLVLIFVIDGNEQAIFVRPCACTCRIPFALASPSVPASAATGGTTTSTLDASGHMAADAAQNGPGPGRGTRP